ncbi:phosphoribosylanthranilate isomerase [Hymenobacter koreensis]|uniref:N-(5'-phosphoribosyl)anthranilate isomerase n=1 Tax=Hymenobacter koreensis TaxID=1084523 RepID=A0ABP8IYB9_9BACT
MSTAARTQVNPLPTPAQDRRLVKVCGMKYPENIAQVVALGPDMLGFIFAPKSPRYAADTLDAAQMRGLKVPKVGVFVNEKPAVIRRHALHFGLDAVQLHGQESAAVCAELAEADLSVIKAFGIGQAFDPRHLDAYAPHCSFFVFDTAGPAAGGNGFAFNWSLLQAYDLPVPYLLAGGLGTDNVTQLKELQLPSLAGFDFNSKLEQAPGLKASALVKQVLTELHG